MTKVKIIIFILAIFLATVNSLCPTGCTTCSNPTTCTGCTSGYFLVNNTFCAQCPTGCSACVQGSDGRPACTVCVAPAQLDSNARCFLCDPNCLTCAASPKNCTSCRDGKQLATNKTCVTPAGCNITNCGACANDTSGTLICSRCLPGYFPFRQSCIPCQFSCESCTLNRALIWPIVSAFWDSAIRSAFNITSSIPPSGSLPAITNNLDFSGMNDTLRKGWTEAFLIASLANSTFANITQFVAIIPANIRFYVENQNRTWDEVQALIAQRFNNITGKALTLQEFNTKIGQAAAELTTCDACGAGFKLSNSTCARCDAGCTECATGLCTACRNGTFLASGAVCTPCTAPCATCSSSATTCTSCVSPASLVGSACVMCQEPCATCQSSSTSTCVTCKKPFSVQAGTGGTCFRCDQDLCDKCQQSNTSICLQCKVGATLIDGRCQLCPANCSSCFVGTDSAICFQCNPGYQLNMTQTNQTICLPCGPGCRSCAQKACLECQPGTFLQTANGTCQKCKKGCTACTSFEVCTGYDSGVLIINDNVVTCRPGCKTCTTPQVCTQCQPRFFLNTGVCKPCEPGCQTCSSATVCTKCVDNLILAGGDCTACVGNCRTCTSANTTECLTCKRGFTLVGTECLHQCQKGCLECEASNSSICITCAQGHSLRADAKCVKCLGSCSGSCDPRNISICLSCVDGFELKDNQCIRCPKGCATCLVGECSTCAPGFTLNQTTNGSFVCAQKCKSPCTVCSSGTCLACETGFNYNNGRCDPDLSCNPNCDFCPAGTEKASNGSCIPCPTNCATCVSGVCSACLPGYFLNSTLCSICQSKCKTCFSAQSCDQCADGFVKQIVSMTSNIADAIFSDNCTACSSNCKTCIVEPDRCTSCPDGSRLKGSRCSGMFTVQYEYEVNIPYQTFLDNSESQNFIQTLSNMTGVDSADNFISYVKQGSTVIGGSMSTSSSSQASSVQSSLGSSVGSYSILSSSASVYYGDSVYTEQKTEEGTKSSVSIGLIIGVAVGGVVAIGIITFVIYKLKCQKKQVKVQELKHDSSSIEMDKY